MLPKTKSVLVALLLAYRALAAPTSYDQQDQVQSVIDALKAHMQADDLHYQFFVPVIDDVEAHLKETGALDAEHVAALNQKIEAMTVDKGLDIDAVGAAALEYLKSHSAFVAEMPREREVWRIGNVTVEMINHVLEQGSDAVKRDCPHPGQLCGGCVIL